MISLCTGCESELSRENMVYWDDRTETDFSEVLELSDYIGLPQEEVIKTLNLFFWPWTGKEGDTGTGAGA